MRQGLEELVDFGEWLRSTKKGDGKNEDDDGCNHAKRLATDVTKLGDRKKQSLQLSLWRQRNATLRRKVKEKLPSQRQL